MYKKPCNKVIHVMQKFPCPTSKTTDAQLYTHSFISHATQKRCWLGESTSYIKKLHILRLETYDCMKKLNDKRFFSINSDSYGTEFVLT